MQLSDYGLDRPRTFMRQNVELSLPNRAATMQGETICLVGHHGPAASRQRACRRVVPKWIPRIGRRAL